ncbi:helix-turn-helix domain-containing protein [Cupriavidus gilardii]|nr:helix-turn-helix domain-containing protein [Cupriavidus gilardii]UXC37428.1 helix-turn-helix domain-containing protein [Cupriavidus gilardii]
MGRPSALSPEEQQQVRQKPPEGVPMAQLARGFKITRQAIMRVRQRV